MEKIKSAFSAVLKRLRRVGEYLKEKFPIASAKVSGGFQKVLGFCKGRPAAAAVIGVICLVAVGSCVRQIGGSGYSDEGLVYEVKRGPLKISVVSSGTIENKEKVIVRSDLEGASATILTLVDEGTRVKEGDLLVEFDTTDFEDKLLDIQIQVGNSSSDVVRASETLAITKNQAEADIEKAKLSLKFAELALKKYMEGDYPQSLQKAKTDITLAEEELRRSEERLAWSEKLSKEDFITRSEYEADELALRKKKIELEMAQKRLEVLEKYTHVVDVERLKSDVSQAKLAMDRVRRAAKADVLKAEVDLSAKEVAMDRAKDRLEKMNDRIRNCRVTAPVDGLVVYATSVQRGHWRRRSEPLAAGQKIEGKEELVYLPTTRGMIVRFDVQEASLTKMKKGLNAVITVDALPGRKFSGVVTKVSVLPDTGQSWLNPDLKVYNCEVDITSSTEGLRPGMSCTVEAVFDHLEDVLFVPVQSVVKVDGKPTVFVKGLGSAKKRHIQTGFDNNRMIHVAEGLEEGEEVLLSPPLQPAEKRPEAKEDIAKPAVPPSRPSGMSNRTGGSGKPAGRRPSSGGKPSGGRPKQ